MEEEMHPLIHLIEDEPSIQELLRFNLEQSGFRTLASSSGQMGIAEAKRQPPALIILDLMLPDLDGMEVCRQLKRHPKTQNVPILILSARGEEIDRVLGLEGGADDYVTKPFSPREVVLRIRAILKRGEEIDGPQQFKAGPLEVDATKPLVRYHGETIPLTALEIRLLQYLYRTRGRVQNRGALLESVWGYSSSVNTRTVDAHIKRLREKLKKGGEMIETIRGLGYRFKDF